MTGAGGTHPGGAIGEGAIVGLVGHGDLAAETAVLEISAEAPQLASALSSLSHTNTHSIFSSVMLLRLAGMEPLKRLLLRTLQEHIAVRQLTGAPNQHSRTHSDCISVTLLRLAGMVPLNRLLLRTLRVQSLRRLRSTRKNTTPGNHQGTHATASCVRLPRLAGMVPPSRLVSSTLQVHGCASAHTRPSPLSHTHNALRPGRVPRQAEMEPPSWFFSRCLQTPKDDGASAHRLRAPLALAHAQLVQLREAAQAGGDGAAELVVIEPPAQVPACKRRISSQAHPACSHARTAKTHGSGCSGFQGWGR